MLFALTLPKEIVPTGPRVGELLASFPCLLRFLGNAIFTLAFCCGVMYLVQENQLKSKKIGAITKRLPSLQVLDDMNYQALKFGFPLLTLGIITGAIWGEYAWGRYWAWDPKETWSLITWVPLCCFAPSASDSGMERSEGRNHGHCWVPGRPFYVLRCEPSSPRLHSYANW